MKNVFSNTSEAISLKEDTILGPDSEKIDKDIPSDKFENLDFDICKNVKEDSCDVLSPEKLKVQDPENNVLIEDINEFLRESDIQGLEDITPEDLNEVVYGQITDRIRDAGLDENDVKIIGYAVIGSRNRHTAREDSDLDIVLYYKGSTREDDLFNILHDEDYEYGTIEIMGIPVDVNPIRDQETGNLDDYLKKSKAYDDYVIANMKEDCELFEEGKKKKKRRHNNNGWGGRRRRYYGLYPFFPILPPRPPRPPAPPPPGPGPHPGPHPPPPGPPPPGPPPGPPSAIHPTISVGGASGPTIGGGGAAPAAGPVSEDENSIDVDYGKFFKSIKYISQDQVKDIISKLWGSTLSLNVVPRISTKKIELSRLKNIIDPNMIVFWPGNDRVKDSAIFFRLTVNPGAKDDEDGLDGKPFKRTIFLRGKYKDGKISRFSSESDKMEDIFQNESEILEMFNGINPEKLSFWVVWKKKGN